MFTDLILPTGIIIPPSIDDEESVYKEHHIGQVPIIGISRHRMFTDGEGITTLVGFSGCPLRCKFCINKACWDDKDKPLYSPLDLYNEIKKDLLYLIATGGGITFGGGEPLLQANFIIQFLEICDNRLNINIETSLNIPFENLQKLLPLVHTFYIDIKDLNGNIYKKYTGFSNTLVLQNLKHIVELGFANKCVIRIPLIPEFNNLASIERSLISLRKMGFNRFDRFTYKKIANRRTLSDQQKSKQLSYGKYICDILKSVRIEIAKANNIDFSPHFCHHKQCSSGTCTICEKEIEFLERDLKDKRFKGKEIII